MEYMDHELLLNHAVINYGQTTYYYYAKWSQLWVNRDRRATISEISIGFVAGVSITIITYKIAH